MDIEANLREVRGRIARACEHSRRVPEEIILVAVTKGFDAQAIRDAFDCGLRHFGENRVQEAVVKIEQLCDLRASITWHMVGHLQSNKARIAVQQFDIIHSIDSVRLASILNERAQKPLPVLLQVNVAGEEPKSGFAVEEIAAATNEIRKLLNLQVKGLMTIAPLVDNPEEVRPVFRKLCELRDSLGLEHLSMGMTDDFEVAIEEGATILRIGRAIFGQRRYS
ncbi:MAG: YggS family pyridoxal phosphate-dependent enzyme [Chloroflexi bacterium]|nr:YggS family pyridoxal phosphate-dependent enzyme [Chloroflexota bacterium]MBM4451434.1 YggS family pyridoxal phosphate-dependent enzyme [Chloroflexota bacterium]